MKTFIKVTEIWVPDKQRTHLEFGSGLYGGLIEFKAASEQQQFAYNEGLPGKAWAGVPIGRSVLGGHCRSRFGLHRTVARRHDPCHRDTSGRHCPQHAVTGRLFVGKGVCP